MPYQLVSAKARTKALDALWEDVALGNTDINEIFRTYRRVILRLRHTALPQDVYLDLADAREAVGIYTGTKTITQWLVANGNATLPTMAQEPTYKLHSARYTDAYRAGYQVRMVDSSRHPDAQLPDRAKPDLLLNRKNVDFRANASYMMATVNGFFHRLSGSVHGLHVIGGARSGLHANNNHIGVMSFREVGALRYVPITADMVYKQHVDQRYADYMMVKLPFDLNNKVVMLVLGGYLHVMDKAYTLTGDRSIRIDMSALQIPERIFDSIDMLDLSSLGLTPGSDNPKHFALDDMLSDRALVAYATLQQSFFVVMDDTDLYVRRHPLERTRIPGRFIHPEPLPQFPLLSSYGRVYDYQPFPQRGKCVLATDPIYWRSYNYQTGEWTQNTTIDPTSYSFSPWRLPSGCLLEIGRVA